MVATMRHLYQQKRLSNTVEDGCYLGFKESNSSIFSVIVAEREKNGAFKVY
jgi:hypothetical protein